MLFSDIRMEQYNASKHEVGHCDRTTLQIVFIFIILNTYVSLFHAKIQPKVSSGSGEEVYFVVFAIFSYTAILDIRPESILNSETLESGHAPCEISEL